MMSASIFNSLEFMMAKRLHNVEGQNSTLITSSTPFYVPKAVYFADIFVTHDTRGTLVSEGLDSKKLVN